MERSGLLANEPEDPDGQNHDQTDIGLGGVLLNGSLPALGSQRQRSLSNQGGHVTLLNVMPPAMGSKRNRPASQVKESKRWRDIEPPKTVLINPDVPPNVGRRKILEVSQGTARTGMNCVQVRAKRGYADRSSTWNHLLVYDPKLDLEIERARYWSRLHHIFDRCHGCEMLHSDHVFNYGAAFLKRADEDGFGESWEEEVFKRHAIRNEEEIDAIKRVLMAVDEDLDLDVAPTFVDLACILALYLSEAEVYMALKKLAAANTSTFTTLQRPSKRTTYTPRKILPQTFHSQSVVYLTFLRCLREADPVLADAVAPWSEQVKLWFERLLMPILPMNHVVILVDSIIAGDDYKVLLRAAFAAVRNARVELIESHQKDPANHDPTDIIRRQLTSSSPVLPSSSFLDRMFWSVIPKRKTLVKLERDMVNKCGRARPKDAIAHVAREAFESSTTILTYEAASRLVKFIPLRYRHTCLRMRSAFQSEIGPMSDHSLSSLYQACSTVKNCVFILVVAAKIPKGESDLREKQFDLNSRTLSTAFSHPLVKEANYTVFGAFSPTPIVPTVAQSMSSYKVTEYETSEDEHTYVFRVAPREAAKKWTNTGAVPNLVSCLKNGIMVGNVTTQHRQTISEGSPQIRSPVNSGLSPTLSSITGDGSGSGEMEQTFGVNVDIKELEQSFRKKKMMRERTHTDHMVGPALYIDQALDHGYTGYCEAFQNEPLCSLPDDLKLDFKDIAARTQHFYFNIFAVEVFVLPKV